MSITLSNVRFWGESGHRSKAGECPILTQSGHSLACGQQRNAARPTLTDTERDQAHATKRTGSFGIGIRSAQSKSVFDRLADRSFSGQKHIFTATQSPGILELARLATATGTSVLSYTTKIDWFGTVRGRIGYLWGDGTVLTYVTGGLSYGKVQLDATSTVSGTVTSGGIGIAPLSVPFSVTHAINHSQINIGWTVGFGSEGRLAGMPGRTWKVESLYMDLGSDPEVDACLNCSSGVSGGLISGHAHFTDAILRGGLNYQFH